MQMHRFVALLSCLSCGWLVACSGHGASDQAAAPAAPATSADKATEPAAPAAPSSAVIAIDGSSTVFPITEAVAEEFQKVNPAKVTIGISGTGGGFKKFCAGETAIADASRPIKPTEAEACAAAKIEFVELPIAYDGLAIVVSQQNTWVKSMTVDELKRLWEPAAQGKIMKWSQIRTGWPDKEVHLFGPGVDSGTYDYFTKAINGEEHKSRGDFTSSEDDNVLVQGVSHDALAIGYFGLAYYAENTDKLKLVPVDDGKDDNGKGPVPASQDTVRNGTYQPLSRPLFIYVSKNAVSRPEVGAFIDFYLSKAETLVNEAHYIALPAKAYELATNRYKKGTAGSLFGSASGSQVGVTVEALLAREQ